MRLKKMKKLILNCLFPDFVSIDAKSGFFLEGDFNMKNTVVVKERDEWSSLAELIGNIVAKYADELEFDSLPDPDEYLMKRDMLEAYKTYVRERKKKLVFNIEYSGIV